MQYSHDSLVMNSVYFTNQISVYFFVLCLFLLHICYILSNSINKKILICLLLSYHSSLFCFEKYNLIISINQLPIELIWHTSATLLVTILNFTVFAITAVCNFNNMILK